MHPFCVPLAGSHLQAFSNPRPQHIHDSLHLLALQDILKHNDYLRAIPQSFLIQTPCGPITELNRMPKMRRYLLQNYPLYQQSSEYRFSRRLFIKTSGQGSPPESSQLVGPVRGFDEQTSGKCKCDLNELAPRTREKCGAGRQNAGEYGAAYRKQRAS
jgi:hypothetical protein